MRHLTYIALAAALIAGAWAPRAARAQDQDAPPSWGGSSDHMMSAKKLKAKLGLTDDEVTKLDAAFKAHWETMKPIRRSLRDGMNKLKDQIEDKAPDADIQATLDTLHKDMQDMQAANDKLRDDVQFLTPTQRAKLLIGMMRRMERGGPGMMGGHHGHGHAGMGEGMGGGSGMGSGSDQAPPPSGDQSGD